MMAWPITALDCGMRNSHLSLPAGTATGDQAICGVADSSATWAMAAATGVATEPISTSTLSAVTSFLACCTPWVGSVASSSTITLSFWPAISLGHSLAWLPAGMPRPEAGPVMGAMTPMVICAIAAPLAAMAVAATMALRV